MQIIFCRYRKFISAHLLDQHYSELKQVSVFMPIPTILRNNTVSQAWHFSVIITQHCALFSLYWHLAWIYGVSTGQWLLELLLPRCPNSLTGNTDPDRVCRYKYTYRCFWNSPHTLILQTSKSITLVFWVYSIPFGCSPCLLCLSTFNSSVRHQHIFRLILGCLFLLGMESQELW